MTTLAEVQAAIDDSRLMVNLPDKGWYAARFADARLRGQDMGGGYWRMRVCVGPSERRFLISNHPQSEGLEWKVLPID